MVYLWRKLQNYVETYVLNDYSAVSSLVSSVASTTGVSLAASSTGAASAVLPLSFASATAFTTRANSVAEVTELRRNLRAEDVEFKVYKNSLVRRATEATDYEGLNAQLTGPNAIAFGNSDAVAPARVLAKFAKDHEALVIKAAVVEGKLLNVEEVKEISSLPNREGMYSMLLGMLQAPVSKFAFSYHFDYSNFSSTRSS